jgi:hypothetical protein
VRAAIKGDRKFGDPVEYDNLKLVLTDDTVEITVFKRGIALFVSDDERVLRIQRVLCKLDGERSLTGYQGSGLQELLSSERKSSLMTGSRWGSHNLPKDS